MHLQLVDHHQAGDSAIHRLDPRVKVALTLLFILTVSLLPFGQFGAYALLWGAVLLVAGLAHVAFGYLLRRSLIAIPFALAAITLPFTVAGQPWLTLPVFGGLVLSVEGSVRFASILVKSWLSLQMAILLVTVTPVADLLWALRALHVPQPLVAIAGFMYRYLFVLGEEVARLLRARAARCAQTEGVRGGGTLAWRGKVAGRMAGSLMIRSIERSERIYNAMLARGYQGQMRVLQEPTLGSRDLLALAAGGLFLAILLATVTF